MVCNTKKQTLWNRCAISAIGIYMLTQLPVAGIEISTATSSNIFGNADTQKVEKQIELLQAKYPRKANEISSKEADNAFKKLQELVAGVSDYDQLMRLGYWAFYAHADHYESPVPLVYGTCDSSLQRIKKLYPKRFEDAVLEIANLICADGGPAEMIDAHLTKNNKPAEKSPPGVYIHVDGMKDASTPDYLALHFNMTRDFWSKWKPNWSGKHRYSIAAKFKLDKDGKPADIKLSTTEFSETPKAMIEQSKGKIQKIIQDGKYTVIPKQNSIGVTAEFYG